MNNRPSGYSVEDQAEAFDNYLEAQMLFSRILESDFWGVMRGKNRQDTLKEAVEVKLLELSGIISHALQFEGINPELHKYYTQKHNS